MRPTAPAPLLLTTALLLSGCGSSNDGGQTTCGDFLEMEDSARNEVVRTWLDSEGEDDPTGGSLTVTRLAALTYCGTVGRSSDPISSVEDLKP